VRISVVTPFLDRRHGTERALTEQLEHLVRQYQDEVHIYAQKIEDMQLAGLGTTQDAGKPGLVWHRVPALPGPHLLQFSWWLVCNTCIRKWSSKRQRLLGDHVTFSAGINCFDADVIVVHALFRRLEELSRADPDEHATLRFGLRHLHRRLLYLLVSALERRIYSDPSVSLAAVSPRIAGLLAQYFGRTDVKIIPNGVDCAEFSPAARLAKRQQARKPRNFRDTDFVLLLIGNDWRTKGLPAILSAMASSPALPLQLLVVGADDSGPYRELATRLGIADCCRWERPSSDVMDFYAAADVYVSPSLEDSFALPVLEAMAGGLPAITSVFAGVSALIHNEVDGFVLSDPGDTHALAQILRRLYEDHDYRERVSQAAAKTAQRWTWDRSAQLLRDLLSDRAAKKSNPFAASS
jgi:glycosyltransferase involved in cell wall biosynthesis